MTSPGLTLDHDIGTAPAASSADTAGAERSAVQPAITSNAPIGPQITMTARRPQTRSFIPFRAERHGNDRVSPGSSGMAIPSESASAPAAASARCRRGSPQTTPTAMPGMLPVQRHGQHHQRRPLRRLSGLPSGRWRRRNDVVERQEEQNSDPEARRCRNERPHSHRARFLDGRDQQTPDRSRDHHACREAGRARCTRSLSVFLIKQHARRPRTPRNGSNT